MAKSFSHPRILPQRGGLRLSDQQRKAATIWYNWYAGGGRLPSCQGGTYDPNAQDVIDFMVDAGATVDDERKGFIDTCIRGIKTDGNWEKLACLQMFNAPTSAASLVNWCNRWIFLPTLVNAPTFSANSGYTGNGTSSYINHGFNDSLSVLLELNSITLSWWNLTDDAQTTIIGGANLGAGDSQSLIQPKRLDTNKAGADCNSAAPANQTTDDIADASGMWTIQRVNDTQFSLYRNGTLIQTFSAASVSKIGLNYYGLAAHIGSSDGMSSTPGGFSTRKLTAFWAGSGDVDIEAMHTRLSTYLTQIGAI